MRGSWFIFVACSVLISACDGELRGNGNASSSDGGRRRDAASVDGSIADARGIVDSAVVDSEMSLDGSAVDSGQAVVDGGGPRDSGRIDSGAVVVADSGARDSGPSSVDSGLNPSCEAPVLPALTATSIVGSSRFSSPIFVTQAPGVSNTLWVVERRGIIWLVRNGAILPTPFLNVSTSLIKATPAGGDERGLLSIAFHPNYASNRRFFIMYTPLSGDEINRDIVDEFRRNESNADVADSTRVARLLTIGPTDGNHNGGMLAFGPDGKLYVGTGDGGGAHDNHGTFGNALNLQSLNGKLLRLDVDASGSGYAASGNPFAQPMGLPQIWAYGLRNPWRFSFDRTTSDLYIGDVGQDVVEEIDVQPASSHGGENYGWKAYEGDSVHDSTNVSRVPVHSAPVVAVRHGSGSAILRSSCAIAGGYVYRGSAIPELSGVYFFGDYCSDDVATFRWCGGRSIAGLQRVSGLSGAGGLVAFGQDNAGEVYLVYIDTGLVAKITRP